MSVRTYNPSVRVGNWNEDLCLEEVRLEFFLNFELSFSVFFFQAEDGIRDCLLSRGLGDVYKRQL